MKRVLNVGGNDRSIPIPPVYDGWEHLLLDIDPSVAPDLVCDARELTGQPAASYDSVYCSHNLEHYLRPDGARVLRGFAHVLKPDGFAWVLVPDVGKVMRIVAEHDLDVDDELYESPAGPITVHDVLYGYGPEIERSGKDWFAHKTGFTRRSLSAALHAAGFPHVFVAAVELQLSALAFLRPPSLSLQRALGLAPPA